MAEKIWIPYKDDRKIKPWSQEYARTQLKNPIREVRPATIKSIRSSPQDVWFVKVRWFNVKTLFKSRLRFAKSEKLDGIRWQEEVIPPFIKRILAGEKFDREKLKTLGYYKYLCSRLNPLVHPPEGPTRKGVRHCIRQMEDMVRLAYNMRDEGLKAPFDMFVSGDVQIIDGKKRDRVILIRGGRRLVIAYYLGWKKVPVRIWRTKHISERYIPTNHWPVEQSAITTVAASQFVKYSKRATDKYWRHAYTYLYDIQFADLKTLNTLKILELGVKGGASLKMWKDAFPKATVYGVDKDLKKMQDCFKGEDIQVFQGNEMNAKFLKKIADEHGPFNIIIDDCNHEPKYQRAAFEALWPYVYSQTNHGGIYVIEDMHHNYRSKFQQDSIIPMLTSKIDDIYKSNEVKSISFHPNICFITKA